MKDCILWVLALELWWDWTLDLTLGKWKENLWETASVADSEIWKAV